MTQRPAAGSWFVLSLSLVGYSASRVRAILRIETYHVFVSCVSLDPSCVQLTSSCWIWRSASFFIYLFIFLLVTLKASNFVFFGAKMLPIKFGSLPWTSKRELNNEEWKRETWKVPLEINLLATLVSNGPDWHARAYSSCICIQTLSFIFRITDTLLYILHHGRSIIHFPRLSKIRFVLDGATKHYERCTQA